MNWIVLFLLLIHAATLEAAVPNLKAEFPQLFMLGEFTAEVMDERSGASTYQGFMANIKLNEENGYYGGDKFPGTTPQDIVNATWSFLELLKKIDQQKLKENELRDIYILLNGSSFGLRASFANVSDVNTILLMQKKLYNPYCWKYADPQDKLAKSFLPFIWMNECLRFEPGNIQTTLIIQNSLINTGMKWPEQKEKAYTLAMAVSYDTAFNPDANTPFADFKFSSKLDDLIQVTLRGAGFAKELKDKTAEYEFLKKSNELISKGSSIGNQSENERRMAHLAAESKKLSYLQIVRLSIEQYLIWFFGIISFGYPLIALAVCATLKRKELRGNGSSILHGTFQILTGDGIKGTLGKLLRTFWLIVAGVYFSLLITASQVDLTKISLE
ncbi:hypothetical protein [Bdellovibrio sp. HCB274]|uniref:hypothetical protein n=1 Tax=Bdellovibrio sp. HCB274 TaxID=3394361 RepID=UPI0039B39B7D